MITVDCAMVSPGVWSDGRTGKEKGWAAFRLGDGRCVALEGARPYRGLRGSQTEGVS